MIRRFSKVGYFGAAKKEHELGGMNWEIGADIDTLCESEVAQSCSTPWTVAYQAPPCMGFSRQEYWSEWPFPSPDLPNSGIELGSPALQADVLPSEPPGK